jgi:hypothetical protein
MFVALTNLYILVGNSSFTMASAADIPGPDNVCAFYKGPPAKTDKVLLTDTVSFIVKFCALLYFY